MGEQGVVGLLGGVVALVGLLIRARGLLVALGGVGMLGLPHLALAVKLNLAAVGLLLKAVLALGGLAFAVPGRGELRFEGSDALAEAREPSQVGELLALGGGVLGLPVGVLSISLRVCHLASRSARPDAATDHWELKLAGAQ